MKKFLSSLFLLTMLMCVAQKANAMRYEEGLQQSKAMALYIYAPWADNYANIMKSFKAMEVKYGEKYNFITMNIATDEVKEFNKKSYIYPNVPYVLLSRDKGKFLRFVKSDCVLDNACFASKLDVFSN